MISWSPIGAIVRRHLYLWRRDFNFLLSGFYWPFLDIVIWGFLGMWIHKAQATLPHYESAALLGILLWQIVGRGCTIITCTFNEELWSHNITNLFSLPLRLSEWMLASVLFTIIIVGMISLFCIGVIGLLYDVSLLNIITTFIIFAPPLFISCLWISFTCLQIVATFGKRGTELGYIIGWSLLPFSGAYYPIEVLPTWAQTLSTFIPMSYIFQGMRNYVMYQQDPTLYLVKGYALGTLYAIIAIAIFVWCFNRSKRKGLGRLMD